MEVLDRLPIRRELLRPLAIGCVVVAALSLGCCGGAVFLLGRLLSGEEQVKRVAQGGIKEWRASSTDVQRRACTALIRQRYPRISADDLELRTQALWVAVETVYRSGEGDTLTVRGIDNQTDRQWMTAGQPRVGKLP